MLNNLYLNKIILLSLVLYNTNVLILSYELDNFNNYRVPNYNKNNTSTNILLIFLSGLPIGVIFLLKFHALVFISYKNVSFIFTFTLITNTIFLLFYLKIFLKIEFSKVKFKGVFFKNKPPRFKEILMKSILILNTFLVFNYNLLLNTF